MIFWIQIAAAHAPLPMNTRGYVFESIPYNFSYRHGMEWGRSCVGNWNLLKGILTMSYRKVVVIFYLVISPFYPLLFTSGGDTRKQKSLNVGCGQLMNWKNIRENDFNVSFLVWITGESKFFKDIIIILIIMSCSRHGYPWPSLATSPYRSSPLVGLQGPIPYPHIAAECMFDLVVLLLPGHMWRSIGVHHLWARPCFSSSVLHVWFV